MFSSNSSHNPFPFTNQIMLESSFPGNENPSSTQQDHPPQLLHFPVSFLDDYNDGLLMSHFFPQIQQQILCSGSNLAGETNINMASQNKATNITNKKTSTVEKEAIPRKRMGKKDRHSKINTARGPRDRRMRLSLQIARKFFDLQDMLGFDKASKTIDWLFSKSKAAIKELTDNFPGAKHSCSGGGKSVSSTSESEVVSGIKEFEENIGDQKGAIAIGESLVGVLRETKKGKSRKAVYNPLARESRDKARERARERTKKKMRGFENSKKCSNEANPNELEHIRSSSPLETGEDLGQEMNSSLNVGVGEEEEPSIDHLLEHQMDSVSIVENFLDIIRSPRSSSTFSYSHNIAASSGANSEENYPVFAGNWDINNDRVHYNYCTVTNLTPLTGNVQVQNPSAIFMTNQNAQEQNPSPVFMINSNPQELTPSSVFMDPSTAHQQNPSSILMSNSNIGLQSHFQENQFSCNPNFSNKYRSLY